ERAVLRVDDEQRPLNDRVVERPWKRHGERSLGRGYGRIDAPRRWIDRIEDTGADAEFTAKRFDERAPLRVTPAAIDRQGVAPSCDERAAHFQVRTNALLDAPRIEQQRVAR